MSENQYLEVKLSEMAKASKRKVAHIREDILKMFPDRELVTMRSPLAGDGDPGDLAGLDPEQLSDEFKADVTFIRAKIINDTPVKQIWSRKITGKAFVFLLTEYVQGLNKQGSRIDFSTDWQFY